MTKREFIKGSFLLWFYRLLPYRESLLRRVLKMIFNHKRRQFLAPKPVRLSGGFGALASGSATLTVSKRFGVTDYPPA